MATQGIKNLEGLHIKKILNRVREIGQRFLYSERTPVIDVVMAETMEHLTIGEAKRLKYKPVVAGQPWGKMWGTAWFRLRIRIPAQFRGETVKLLFDLGNSESLIFRNGLPVQSLCPDRTDYILFDKARGNERVELYVEGGANARLGDFDVRPMNQPEIAIFNAEVWDAYWDLSALADMIDPKIYYDWTGKPYYQPPEHDTRRARIVFELNKAVDLFDYDEPSREELREQARQVRKGLKSIYDSKANASAQTFAAMGHAHIDVAWLWPLSETVRKVGRTFSNVLELMDHYPEFVFAQSQPHLYEFARENYPSLYRRVCKRVKEGCWAPTGCMWVEPDCNVTSGESLVRQALFGTRFFKQEFGHDISILWLPDVFGYSAALPQILKRSGIQYFFTTKISINQFTRFPHNSFYWEGIDGSQVLTHFMPAEEYSSEVEPWVIRTGEYRYVEKDRSSIQILPFGRGDGGGGPLRSHLERMKRYRDLEGMPKVEPMTPDQFFERLETESENLSKWVGELYLEFHRGTYTTQAYTKKSNRKSELLLRETEMIGALNTVIGGRYERKRLNDAWKLVLLNQFHDILPGSSIDEVYADSDRQYAEVFNETNEVKASAFEHLAKKVDTRGDGAPVLAFNSLSWERNDVIEVALSKLRKGTSYVAVTEDGTEQPVQIGADGMARFLGGIPSIGHNVFHIQRGTIDQPCIEATENGMENDRIRVKFDPQGRIRRLYDKAAKRDVLEPVETGNRFILFEDKMATSGAAWDIDIFYNDKPIEIDGVLESVEVIERGPVRSVVRFKRALSKSKIIQDVILTAGSARVDFATTIEWGDEKDVLLKVAFPVNVRCDKARYEIQFGSVERPTHWNMPQDFARFEVPAQKWADLSEGNYGVALLNDCKYGYDIKDNVMRLTLLRAPKSPGETADVNKTHTFTYGLFPHTGDFSHGVVREGYELNVPITAEPVKTVHGKIPACLSRMSVSGENVVIDTVKKAEDDDGIIVRLYEAHGWRGRHVFQTSLPIECVVETDLMENEEQEIPVRNGKASLDFKPFQIRTLKLVLAGK
ncbi:MAG: alpha-mannosidase [bacterium]